MILGSDNVIAGIVSAFFVGVDLLVVILFDDDTILFDFKCEILSFFGGLQEVAVTLEKKKSSQFPQPISESN
jgi:hypothetical protein